MDQQKNKNIKDFIREKTVWQDKAVPGKIRNTFYRTKPGCYCPPPYQLKYRKLSEILNNDI